MGLPLFSALASASAGCGVTANSVILDVKPNCGAAKISAITAASVISNNILYLFCMSSLHLQLCVSNYVSQLYYTTIGYFYKGDLKFKKN